jgi:putative sterol carrier protein
VTAHPDVQKLLGAIAALKQRAQANSYMSVAAELGDMNTQLKTALPQMNLQDASDVMQAFYPLVFDGMVELSNTDPSVQQKLRGAEDVTYVLKVEEVGFALCLRIKGGQFSYEFAEPSQIDVTMKTSPEALVRIMTGQTDALEAFMDGEVQAEGAITKARGLRGVFETLGDKFGFRLMEFSA